MASPTSILVGEDSRVPEGSSHHYVCTLEDRGVPIQVAAITAISGWLSDNESGAAINSRADVNLLNNAGGVLADAGGGVAQFTWHLEAADAAVVGGSDVVRERHRITLKFTYTRSGLPPGTLTHRVLYDLDALEDIT